MLRLPSHNQRFHLLLRNLSSFASKTTIFMTSKHFLPSPLLPQTLSPKHFSTPTKRLLPSLSSKPIPKNHSFSLRTNGFCSLPSPSVSSPSPAYSQDLEDQPSDTRSLQILNHKLKQLGIDITECVAGRENRLKCPSCNGGESGELSLSLFISLDGYSASWLCFRAKCGWKGYTKAAADGKPSIENLGRVNKVKVTRQITVESLQLEPLCNQLTAYFAERMISSETLKRNAIMQKRSGDEIAIAFTYWRNGELVNCKYRDIVKRFWQEKDTEKILYGLDDIEDASDIIIVEGEMDKLAMEEAGFRNCVSVPDGAPPSVSKKEVPAEEQDTKYQYLWNCKEYFKKASRIILATDGDLPGQALAEELARRLGRERCWRVKWPKKNDVDHFKDANEVLMYLGPSVLKDVIDNAELYPIRGLFNFSSFFDEIDQYYHRTLGYEFGVSTGWRALDDLYNVVPGELTIVTGVPNSGKSEWIDALLCNLNEGVGWKFALCSMENKVRDHARKLLEKSIKKPFFGVGYGSNVERMSVEELEKGKKWLSDTFQLIRCENDSLPSIQWVLELARAAVLRHGVQGLVIDPYNELDHQRPVSQTETEYVSQMLTKIKRFAQHHSCHVWFVAHPRQLHHWIGAPPNLYDISGSAHFINKCDNGIVIHRNRDPDAGPVDLVQVCVRKVRNKVVGNIGDAFLSYDRVTGVYNDIDESQLKLWKRCSGWWTTKCMMLNRWKETTSSRYQLNYNRSESSSDELLLLSYKFIWLPQNLTPSPIQALFAKLQQLATVAGDVLLGKEKLQKILLARLTETVLMWLSNEQDFWGVFEDKSTPLQPLGLQQLILDMHFTVEIARFAGYPSRHVHQIASAITARAIRTFTARDVESALPVDEWFVETAKSAINKLLMGASGSDTSEIDDDHIILHDEIISDSDDTASSLSSVESFESFASASMAELESPTFTDQES